MIRINEKEIKAVSYGAKTIKAVYVGLRAVWSTIASCFGGGRWKSAQPWRRNEKWKNM